MLTETWETISQINRRTKAPVDEILSFLKVGHIKTKTVECRFNKLPDGKTVCEWRNKSN